MKFGYYFINTYVPELDGADADLYARWLEQIDAAEDLGFDSVWATEHHFRLFGGMMPNPQLFLAAMAQRTRRLRLGTSVSLVAMHHPVRIAEDFAVLDQLSDGRVNFGVGRGMSPREYAIFGSSYDTAQVRLAEALEIIVKAWTGETLDWSGEHYQYRGFTVRPRPRQRPHPPIYMTANRELEHFQMIGRRGYHLMTLPWIFSNELQRPKIEVYLDALENAGHAAADRDVFVMYPIYVGATDEEARADARDRWHRWRQFVVEELELEPGTGRYEQTFNHLSYEAMVRDSRAVFGGPETCVRHLMRIRDVVKPTHVGLTFHFAGLGQKKVLQSMERFARNVMPALRESVSASHPRRAG